MGLDGDLQNTGRTKQKRCMGPTEAHLSLLQAPGIDRGLCRLDLSPHLPLDQPSDLCYITSRKSEKAIVRKPPSCNGWGGQTGGSSTTTSQAPPQTNKGDAALWWSTETFVSPLTGCPPSSQILARGYGLVKPWHRIDPPTWWAAIPASVTFRLLPP